MSQSMSVLNNVRVASPCPESWAGMSGNDRVRHCERCSLNVFNLSDMNREEAEELIRNTEGRLCVRYHARADGTVITKDCPVGRGIVRRRVARIVACAVAVFAALVGGVFAITGSSSFRRTAQLRDMKAFAPICDRLSPRLVQTQVLMGDIYIPPKRQMNSNGDNGVGPVRIQGRTAYPLTNHVDEDGQ